MADKKQYAANCPHCETRLRVQQSDLGANRTCPKCKKVFAIPAPKEGVQPAKTKQAAPVQDEWTPPVELPVICRVCQTRYYAGEQQIGQRLPCPDCQTLNEVFPPPKKKQTSQQRNSDVRLTGANASHQALPGRHPDQFRVICRVCDTPHYCLPKQVGDKIRCVDCGSVFQVPQAPPKKEKSKVVVDDPGFRIRPAAETPVYKSNASQLMNKANEKYHEKEAARPAPPERPFLDQVWSLPWRIEILPAYVVISLLSSFVPYLVVLALMFDGLGALMGMALMASAGVLALLTLLALSNVLLAITVSSSMGHKKIDTPPFEMLAYFMSLVLFGCSVIVCLVPGVLLGKLIGNPMVNVVMLPFVFFVYPFVYLSMLDASSAAVPYTRYMASTLKANRSAWKRFYLVSLPAFLLALVPLLGVMWIQSTASDQYRESPAQIVVFVLAMCLSLYGVLVYYCLVGRLAWVIDQENKAKQTDDEEDPQDQVSEEVAVAT